jgi:hypothetical protein
MILLVARQWTTNGTHDGVRSMLQWSQLATADDLCRVVRRAQQWRMTLEIHYSTIFISLVRDRGEASRMCTF